MKTIVPKLIGGLGNQMFIWAHAKALAEQQCMEFQCEPWIGETVFDLNDPRPTGTPYQIVDGYCQHQAALIYTRRDCKRWFTFGSWAQDYSWPHTAAHIRRGDYGPLGYVLVSRESYYAASAKFNASIDRFYSNVDGVDSADLMRRDFLAMASAKILFRGNSTFSWWAATLSDAKIYSPVIDGLEGGMTERDCEFVEGNWPKLANLPNITDLHLEP